MQHRAPAATVLFLAAACQSASVTGVPKSPGTNETDQGFGLCSFNHLPRTTDRLAGCQPYEVRGFEPVVEWTGARGKNVSATPIVADLDADGTPEIVAGRAIFTNQAVDRAVGIYGRGSYGVVNVPPPAGPVSEATIPAVADLDLDGKQEVIVGNAIYDADGNALWDGSRPGGGKWPDGMVSVANLDDDPEGEFVATSWGTIRAHDTDGTLLWGPIQFKCLSAGCQDTGSSGMGDDDANILANAAIGDIDDDGYPEVITAGGSQLIAINHDGTGLWVTTIQDVSGATGASIFDFEGDGVEEVVYIDEVGVYAYDGPTGTLKFKSNKHGSRTLMDYPVIADVDGDGQAEIIVGHMEYGPGFSVYGEGDGTWAPARPLWNQHAYSITNIKDDFSIPATPVQAFTTHNTWHSATDPELYLSEDRYDLQVEIKETCELECAAGILYVAVQPINRSQRRDLPTGIPITLYGVSSKGTTVIDTLEVTASVPSGSTGEVVVFQVPAGLASGLDELVAVIDDNGAGGSAAPECVEDDNVFRFSGPFCAP